ncbi:MAG: US12 family protein [Bacilli bacterium]|nr:US12 family protein [Bacilli bacterium]
MASNGVTTIAPEDKVSVNESGKSLARVFGYLSLGLFVTAAVAFGLSLLFVSTIGMVGEEMEGPVFMTYLILLIVSFALSFALRKAFTGSPSTKVKVLYLVYAGLMGVMCSSLLVAGIDFWVIGEAFGITAISFGVMFLIGYFSKANLNVIGAVASAFVMTIFLSLMVFWLVSLISGVSFYSLALDIVVSLILSVFILILVAVNSYNMKHLIEAGAMSRSMELYFAVDMYCDFMIVFLRVLRVLILVASKKD